MKTRWHIRSPWEEITLVALSGASENDRRLAMKAERAVPLLRRSLVNPANGTERPLVSAILSEVDGQKGNLTRTSSNLLQSRLERAVREGRLLAIASAFASGSGIFTEAKPEEPGEAPPPPAQEREKTWIEVQLLDFNGKPLAGHPFRLELPDGTVREGKVNAEGLARIADIDPGNCKLTWKRQTVETYRLEETESAGKAG